MSIQALRVEYCCNPQGICVQSPGPHPHPSSFTAFLTTSPLVIFTGNSLPYYIKHLHRKPPASSTVLPFYFPLRSPLYLFPFLLTSTQCIHPPTHPCFAIFGANETFPGNMPEVKVFPFPLFWRLSCVVRGRQTY